MLCGRSVEVILKNIVSLFKAFLGIAHTGFSYGQDIVFGDMRLDGGSILP